MAESNNLANNGKRLSGEFHPSVEIADLLRDIESWQFPLGLYFTQRLGHELSIDNSFSMAPLTIEKSGQLVGILANFQGFEIGFVGDFRPGNKGIRKRQQAGDIAVCSQRGETHNHTFMARRS